MKALFKPQTVEDMMQMLLHMTEYTAFSSLMRAKVQQRFVRELERRKKERIDGFPHVFDAFPWFFHDFPLETQLAEAFRGVLGAVVGSK